MIKVGIIGGAGYAAGELLRLLIRHPKVTIQFVQSNSQANLPVVDIHADLTGELTLSFVKNMPTEAEIDVIFLCSGHGKSRSFLKENPFSRSFPPNRTPWCKK